METGGVHELNDIGDRQNAAWLINLLRARSRVFAQVKRVQRAYFVFALLLPLISLVVAFHLEDAKPWIGLLALVVGAVDAMVIDSWRKRRLKTAARMQEEFDSEVLSLPWNDFAAGKKVSPEEVNRFAMPPFAPKRERQLQNWYPSNARELPLHLARLVCQRTNLWYDSKLRSTYRTALSALALIYFFGLLAFAWKFTVAEFILVALVPFGPFFTWTVREHHRQSETISLVERLLSEIDGSLEKFIHPCDATEAQVRSRELQDAIFAHRSSSPLVSGIVYWLKRPTLERQMEAGPDAFIGRIRRLAGVPA